MKYEFSLPNFEEQTLLLDVRFLFKPRILANKKVAPAAKEANAVVLRRDDGLSSIIHFIGKFPDPIPVLELDDEIYHVVKPLTWPQYIWAVLPLVLAIVEILAFSWWGMLIALVCSYANFWLLRLRVENLEKNLMIFAVNTAAILSMFLIHFMMISSRLGL